MKRLSGMKVLLGKLINLAKICLPVMIIWSFMGIALFDGVWSPCYRVRDMYGMVITQFDGERYANTEQGIYSRVTSINPFKWVFNIERCSMRSESFHLDNDPNPHALQAADKIRFMGSGMFRYRKVDLYKFGVTMGKSIKNAEEMLATELNSLAKSVIQGRTLEENITEIEETCLLVFASKDKKKLEEKYGIVIEAFKMTSATYPDEMAGKAAEAKGLKIMGDAANKAADDFKQAKMTRADADKYHLQMLIEGSGVTTEEGRKKALETVRDMDLYEMLRQQPRALMVIPHGSGAPNLTLPEQR